MTPLARRLPRELRHNLGKYVGLFFLLCLSISMVSGFLVAARSIQRVIADTRAASNLQDFSVTTQFRMPDEALLDLRASHGGIDVAEDFYADLDLTYSGLSKGKDVTARVYGERKKIDKVTYEAGRAPSATGEVALDRNFMESNGLALGDTVTVSGTRLKIVGQVVMPDYECMVRKNTDLMFDSQDFSVAQVSADQLESLLGDKATYHYVCRFRDRDLSLRDRTSAEGDISKALEKDGVAVTDLIDREANTAITFVDEDLEGDQQGWEVILFLLIIISAFIFVVLTDATVEQESAVIGTLLASGYRKGELVRHYMTLPTLVGVLAAVVGNAIGYGTQVTTMAGLYYHSYSLPTFRAYFDPATFVETTIVPLALLVLITYVGVRRKLNATPLAFLRHEVGHRSRRSAARLPERWSFAHRFRTRVFLRNVSHFAVLFLGIVLSSLLMVFGLAMLPIVHHAADQMASSVRAGHVYVLKAPLQIDETSQQREAGSEEEPAAEKFSVTSLELARPDGDGTESVSVYGVKVGSDYWDDVDVSGGKIVIGKGLVEKYGFRLGRTIRLSNKFTGDKYVLAPTEVAGNDTDTNIYMSRATFAEVFPEVTDGDAGYFNGYASDHKLDLDERYVLSETTPEDMRVLADQMDTSMGDIMNAMLWLAIPMSIVLIYLLTKTVIDRSARYISYMKVFGYREREIQGLYLRPVTWTVIGSYVLSIPLVIWLAKLLLREYLMTYSGNIELVVEPQVMAESLVIGIATYLVVAAVHVLRIRRVSLSLALKVQE